VYRVEGTPNTRILIGERGQVSILGQQTLFLNFGDKARAEAYLAQKITKGLPGASTKMFEVPKETLETLRAVAVPERMAKQFPGRPIVVDATKASDQFGLRKEQLDLLQKLIVEGSGKGGQ
jgi:filamentous hemagglutinin